MDFKINDEEQVSDKVCDFQLIADENTAIRRILDENFHVGQEASPFSKLYDIKLNARKMIHFRSAMATPSYPENSSVKKYVEEVKLTLLWKQIHRNLKERQIKSKP